MSDDKPSPSRPKLIVPDAESKAPKSKLLVPEAADDVAKPSLLVTSEAEAGTAPQLAVPEQPEQAQPEVQLATPPEAPPVAESSFVVINEDHTDQVGQPPETLSGPVKIAAMTPPPAAEPEPEPEPEVQAEAEAQPEAEPAIEVPAAEPVAEAAAVAESIVEDAAQVLETPPAEVYTEPVAEEEAPAAYAEPAYEEPAYAEPAYEEATYVAPAEYEEQQPEAYAAPPAPDAAYAPPAPQPSYAPPAPSLVAPAQAPYPQQQQGYPPQQQQGYPPQQGGVPYGANPMGGASGQMYPGQGGAQMPAPIGQPKGVPGWALLFLGVLSGFLITLALFKFTPLAEGLRPDLIQKGKDLVKVRQANTEAPEEEEEEEPEPEPEPEPDPADP